MGSNSWFGPPEHVKAACRKWCAEASSSPDAKEACDACDGGAQVNPKCVGSADCGYCEREIVFHRHYPKLWREESSFGGKMAKLEGSTRCWCDTGCPVYYTKSWLFCHKECKAVCDKQSAEL